MKKVSILMPLYNAEQFVAETIECCLAQTYHNIELIIVDDGSTDNSLAIAKKYEEKDNRIHVYSQPNSGGCRARNVAFEKCTGDFIKYLDADDLMSCDLIEKQMALLEKENDPYAVSVCAWEEVNDFNKIPHTHRNIYKNYELGLDLIEDAWNYNEWYVVSCYLTSRELIKDTGLWDESLLKNQDTEFFCRVLTKANKIIFENQEMFYYRRGHISVSTFKSFDNNRIQSMFVARKKSIDLVMASKNTPRIRRGAAKFYSSMLLTTPYGSKLYKDVCHEISLLKERPHHPSPSNTVKRLESLIGFNHLMLLKSILRKIHLHK